MSAETIYSTVNTPAVGSFGSPIVLPWNPGSITVVNEDATAANYVEVSFDGTTVHQKLIPGTLAGRTFNQRTTRVWLRAGAGAPTVRITAEAP